MPRSRRQKQRKVEIKQVMHEPQNPLDRWRRDPSLVHLICWEDYERPVVNQRIPRAEAVVIAGAWLAGEDDVAKQATQPLL